LLRYSPAVHTFIRGIAALSLVATASACSGGGDQKSPPTSPVPLATVQSALLPADQVDAVMGVNGMTPGKPFTSFQDDRMLLPNVNCLGVYQPAEAAVYSDSGSSSVTGQIQRQPDTDAWDVQVVQAGTVYPSSDAAKAFFAASSDRWSKCTNHTVHLTVAGGPSTTFKFGDLDKSDTQLSTSFTRNENERSCQRVLSVVINVVVDVKACNHDSTDSAATIVQQVNDRLTR
jgi:hypothetical protein